MGTWKGDSNPGGPGGRTRKIKSNAPRGKTSHKASGSSGKGNKAMVSISIALLAIPATVFIVLAVWLANGYGVI